MFPKNAGADPPRNQGCRIAHLVIENFRPIKNEISTKDSEMVMRKLSKNHSNFLIVKFMRTLWRSAETLLQAQARYLGTNMNSDTTNYFVLLGGMADFNRADGDALLSTLKGDHVVWTAHKNMRPGDLIFFYITAPISSVVASGIVRSEIWINAEKDSRWSNYPMAEIKITNHLDEKFHISMKNLRGLFPEWKWLAYPRVNCIVPEEIQKPFLELFKYHARFPSKP